jgi:hypothetical protein
MRKELSGMLPAGEKVGIGIGCGGYGAEMLRERVPVIAAPTGSLSLIGATALVDFGVEVNPLQKRPKPVPALTAGFLSPG